jgi:hypothetical protein
MIAKYSRLLGIVAGLAAAGWVMGYGYWHMNITNSMAAVENQVVPWTGEPRGYRVNMETRTEFEDCGQRALPYVVEKLTTDRSPAYLAALSNFYVDRTNTFAPRPNADDLRIVPTDTPEEIERKCEAIKSEWTIKLSPRHVWWKWWSSENLE